MKTERQRIGRNGEDEAARYLEGLGHTIVCRNWRNSHLELDIISLCRNVLHIVEVKSRTAPAMAEPELNVNSSKRRRMVAAAGAFLGSDQRALLPDDLEVFFDVLTVVFDGPDFDIEYYPQAFIPTYA
jgi:putative endonuclease